MDAAEVVVRREQPEGSTPIEERRVQLETEIPRLQGEIDLLKIQHLSQAEVVSAVTEDIDLVSFIGSDPRLVAQEVDAARPRGALYSGRGV